MGRREGGVTVKSRGRGNCGQDVLCGRRPFSLKKQDANVTTALKARIGGRKTTLSLLSLFLNLRTYF